MKMRSYSFSIHQMQSRKCKSTCNEGMMCVQKATYEESNALLEDFWGKVIPTLCHDHLIYDWSSLPLPALPCPALPWLILPRPALPFLALPCLALPFLALAWPALPALSCFALRLFVYLLCLIKFYRPLHNPQQQNSAVKRSLKFYQRLGHLHKNNFSFASICLVTQ